MTECTTKAMAFSSVGKKDLAADFRGGKLTSDAGVVLLREADKKLGLSKILSDCIPDPRDQRYVKHSQKELIAQRVYGIVLGYEDLNDHNELRKDPALKVAAGRGTKDDEDLGSAPTLCRLENRIDRKALWKMAEAFVDMFISSFFIPPKQLTLDFDASDAETHGRQEKRFFHGYYDHYCYLPLYVFCGSRLVTALLRPANIDASLYSRAVLKMLLKKLRRRWPHIRIVVRGDSGFCRWPLMRWCERRGIKYIFGIGKNEVLKRLGAGWIQEAERKFEESGEKQRIFGEFRYAAKTWRTERRVIVKAEHLSKGANTRFIVTNLTGFSQNLYDNIYCKRGEMENRIKEQQLGLFGDRMSCHKFLSNQLRLFLAAGAYVLVEYIRRVLLADTELACAQADTIRLKLLKIGARVVESARRIVFHLAGGYPFKELFEKVVGRVMGLPPVAAETG